MLQGLAKEVWLKKYKDIDDTDWSSSARRVAHAIANNEKEEENFYHYINDQIFITGGRILNGAGTKNNFLLNCAVLGIKDSIEEIYNTIKRSAVLAKSNYGTGFNFSKLRPKGSHLSKGGYSSGPVSFMKIFDTSGSVIQTGGGRRAAAIAVLNVDHPDIEEFIDAKATEGVLTQFNISVGITRDFIEAVKANADWDLFWGGTKYKTIKARDLWSKLCKSAWAHNDPGLLFIDEINYYNNGWYLYSIDAVNPCGELPLPEDGVCCLGNINMTKFVREAFSTTRDNWTNNFNFQAWGDAITNMVRFLDNVLDESLYPYPEMKERAQNERRIGLNPFAGLGSTLAMLCIPYDSKEAIEFVNSMGAYALTVGYQASINLAKERGPFASLNLDKYLSGNFIAEKLGHDLQHQIRKHGIRNIAIFTVPPVGTGSLLAGNISNGLEPIFSLEYNRKVRQEDGTITEEPVEDYAWKLYKQQHVGAAGYNIDFRGWEKPDFFKTSKHISPKAHVDMQATVQKYIDGSISKTCNMPEDFSQAEYEDLLMYAIDSGCKGFTTFREGTREGVLTEKKDVKVEQTIISSKHFEEPAATTRPRVLDGKTYQIKEEGDHRTYCTINHIEVDGVKKPWEIFLFSSSRNHEQYAAIGRLASRLMRKTGDVDGVIKELKEIGGENGYLTKEYGYVSSKPQHFGFILEEYCKSLSPIEEDVGDLKCPECGEMSYHKSGGCGACCLCGYSTCG